MNEVPTAEGGPGFLAFVAFFLLALALWFLMRNMNSRMRRMSYRQQAAHRGKDDPQATPDDLDTVDDGAATAPPVVDGADAKPEAPETGPDAEQPRADGGPAAPGDGKG